MAPRPQVNEAELVSFSGAAAGHDGVLTDAAGTFVIKPCTIAESAFYESAMTNHPEFAARLPTFYGRLSLSTPEQKEAIKNQDPMSISAALQAQEGTAQDLVSAASEQQRPQPHSQIYGKKLQTGQAIVLENIADGFVKPNTLDVKLGARLWDDDAGSDKRQRLDQVSMETTSHELGFRIAGMRVWRPETRSNSDEPQGQFESFDKFYGRNLRVDNVRSGFEEFFLDGPASRRRLTPLRRAVLELCEAEVLDLEQQLKKLETRMYSASILFVYEGDNKALDKALRGFEALQKKQAHHKPSADGELDEDALSDDDEEQIPKMHAVKLIDFAHAHWTPGQGRDENMLKGVRNVGRILREMLREDET